MEYFILADGSLIWPAWVTLWDGGQKVRKLRLAFLRGKEGKSLIVTVNDITEEELNIEDLIPFLQLQKVIEGEWFISETEDTDGHTELDDTYATFHLERK